MLPSQGLTGLASGLLTDLRKAARLEPVRWLDLLRAFFELAIANRKLGARSTSELLAASRDRVPVAPSQPLTPAQQAVADRIAYAIPRIGARVPWRADCLVQALAARRWLARHGINSALSIGVCKDAEFAAHAWLKVGEQIITGGDIAGYAQLYSEE